MRVFLLILAVLLGHAAASAALAAPRNGAEDLVVMVRGEIDGIGSTIGAGIVVATTDAHVYVATARHVVRWPTGAIATGIEVEFHARRGVGVPARVLDHGFGQNVDLAVLAVDIGDAPPLDLDRPRARLTSEVVRGEELWLVGHGGGVPWASSPAGEPVTEVLTVRIKVHSPGAREGMSGGAAVDADGLIAGMIVRDSPPEVELLPIRYVVELLQAAVPVQLRGPDPVAAAPPIPSGRLAMVLGQITLYHEPKVASLALRSLSPGERVTVLEEISSSWHRVRLHDGREGFVFGTTNLRFRN